MKLEIEGARENNLKNIDIQFSAGLIAVTGLSGSGKSSLVFDTIYHESQRRFQEMFTLGASRDRLQPAKVDKISGLLPSVAVGQNLLNRNPNSTLATGSGLHPLLRLLYARFGTRHCPVCGSPVRIYDHDSIIHELENLGNGSKLIVPLVKNVVGSHKTLLRTLANSFDLNKILVDGQVINAEPLSSKQSHTIQIALATLSGKETTHELRGYIDQSLALGSTSIKIKKEGNEITFSLAPVCAECGKWLQPLEPQHFNRSCPTCQGTGCKSCQHTGMHPNAAAARWEGMRFDQHLNLSITEAKRCFEGTSLPKNADRLASEIATRLTSLDQVGLGYVTLDRPVPTLSRGEAQRLRIAVILTGRLSDLLHLLDEPTIGQHPQDVDHLMSALADLSGPVVFIEHDRNAVARVESVVDLGPGAGKEGGRVIFSGKTSDLWQEETPSGRFFSFRERVTLPEKHPKPKHFLRISGAHKHNLANLDIPIAKERLNIVCGVSGSGKSTLVEDVLHASIKTGKPVGCENLDYHKLKSVLVDQSPIGRNPRSNPATYTKLLDDIRNYFSDQTGLDATNFSFNTQQGACQVCNGMGAVEIKMRYLPSSWIPCSECDGKRFSDIVLDAKVNFHDGIPRSIADVFDLNISEALRLFSNAPGLSEKSRNKIQSLLTALEDIGLGYLTLGQPSPTLSGGEAQRVKLAKYLGNSKLSNRLLILDEPSTGLHPGDIHGLLIVLDRLVKSGGTIVVVEHNTDIIRAADWLIELGPGAGPEGGRLLFAGPPEELGQENQTPTSCALANESSLEVKPLERSSSESSWNTISVRGARANNLIDVDIDIPKNALTVVTGLSGSGKSSLVGDVIESEAKRRYFESLNMYERQSVHERHQADVDSVSGLGVTLAISTQHGSYNQRAHVGDDTEIIQHLAVFFALAGEINCPECNTSMIRNNLSIHCPKCNHNLPMLKPRHFLPITYAAACLTCHGVGTLQEPRPEKLIIHPNLPLCDGAMYSPGFFPKGYLCKPYNGGYDKVQALSLKYDFDPASTPWNEMTPEAQQAFLFGDPEPMLVTYINRKGITTTREESFPGFYGWIRDWDQGGTYTETVACPDCLGCGLREPYRSIRLRGKTIFELRQMSLEKLFSFIVDLPNKLLSDTNPRYLINKTMQRLKFLCAIGLGYLHLDRLSATLSAGEAQRIRLAGLLGGELSGLTLLIDEPTRGLHPSEVEALNTALSSLKQENTVIVVEHDPQIINKADYVIDMGPGAGRFGGQVDAKGSPKIIAKSETYTGKWLRGESKIRIPASRRKPERWLKLINPCGHNLKLTNFSMPLNLLVGVCGVSGSGKSTLIDDTLARILAPVKQTTSVAYEPITPLPYGNLQGRPEHCRVISQTRAGLHNPASFLGVEKAFRRFFAQSELAISLDLNEQSLKRDCSACGGRGTSRIDMGFLPDIFEKCEVCGGSGYPPEVNLVRCRGYTLPGVLTLSIEEAHQIFSDELRISAPLEAAVRVGLGYLILNQPGHTLSGGEAQRLKIAERLHEGNHSDTLFILDEPTIGQHLEDINKLIEVLQFLVDSGQSVLVVEHNPNLLTACDWLIELGPGGGPLGGNIIAEGSPEYIARLDTPTAPYLRHTLEVGS